MLDGYERAECDRRAALYIPVAHRIELAREKAVKVVMDGKLHDNEEWM